MADAVVGHLQQRLGQAAALAADEARDRPAPVDGIERHRAGRGRSQALQAVRPSEHAGHRRGVAVVDSWQPEHAAHRSAERLPPERIRRLAGDDEAVAPAASATRAMAPTLPGSWTSTATTTSGGSTRAAEDGSRLARGRAAMATTPHGEAAGLIASTRASATWTTRTPTPASAVARRRAPSAAASPRGEGGAVRRRLAPPAPPPEGAGRRAAPDRGRRRRRLGGRSQRAGSCGWRSRPRLRMGAGRHSRRPALWWDHEGSDYSNASKTRSRAGRELKTELPKEIQRARELGDLRENAEYKAAKERQDFLNARIAMLKRRVARSRSSTSTSIPHDRARGRCSNCAKRTATR